ncbi:MAG: hypothetical protein H6737_07110 [Alphaproteobacteria bacterium]|nr:hypothetical protein [Alphaproteobacteria bacterium]
MTLSTPDSIITEVEITESYGHDATPEAVLHIAPEPPLPTMAWVLSGAAIALGVLGGGVAVWSGIRVLWAGLMLLDAPMVWTELSPALVLRDLFVVVAMGLRCFVGTMIFSACVGTGLVVPWYRKARPLARVATAMLAYLLVFGFVVALMDASISLWAERSLLVAMGGDASMIGLTDPVVLVYNVIPTTIGLFATIAGLAVWSWIASAARRLEWSFQA